jgi:NADH:ubiquinone oxidoreductase subunit 4 (subunit M)
MQNYLLTILIFLPTIGAVLTMLVKGRDAIRWTALGTCIVTFLLSLLLFAYFDWNKGDPNKPRYAYESDGGNVQLVQEAQWIPAFNIQY